VLDRPDMPTDPRFATNNARNTIREETNRIVGEVFARHTWDALVPKLEAAQLAYARVSSLADLSAHPQLRRTTFGSSAGPIELPALAATIDSTVQPLGRVPELGEHTEKVRAEFAAP
jgi:itaconate CoA-transferase